MLRICNPVAVQPPVYLEDQWHRTVSRATKNKTISPSLQGHWWRSTVNPSSITIYHSLRRGVILVKGDGRGNVLTHPPHTCIFKPGLVFTASAAIAPLIIFFVLTAPYPCPSSSSLLMRALRVLHYPCKQWVPQVQGSLYCSFLTS